MSTLRIAWLVAWVASLVAVYQLAHRDDATAPRIATAPESRPAAVAERAGCALDERDVHRWIAEAVRDHTGQVARTAPTVRSAPGEPVDDRYEPELDPELAARAYDKGQELLRVANARGTWTRSDAALFRPLMLQLPADQRHALADALFDAIGANRLRSEVPGAPF